MKNLTKLGRVEKLTFGCPLGPAYEMWSVAKYRLSDPSCG